MLSIFCLRLAVGLMATSLLLPPSRVNPRFFRAQCWIAFGLTVAAALFAREFAAGVLWTLLAVSAGLAFAGSIVWAIDGTPGGRGLLGLSAIVLVSSLAGAEWCREDGGELGHRLAADFSSAAVLGSAMTAMLLGHFYLIAPGMAIGPLIRLLTAVVVAVGLRMAISGFGVWCWTTGHSLTNLSDVTVLWLPVRWGIGFVGPLVLVYLAWRTARIRSTQSATGILYVAVIFCFLGELTGQLLWSNTGVLL